MHSCHTPTEDGSLGATYHVHECRPQVGHHVGHELSPLEERVVAVAGRRVSRAELTPARDYETSRITYLRLMRNTVMKASVEPAIHEGHSV
jgi:hypothetical protein